MNNAIIFIRDEDERQLSKTPYLGGNLLLHAVKEVRKVTDLKNVYVVGADSDVPGCIIDNNVAKIVSEIEKEEGKTLLLSPLIPELSGDDLQRLILKDADGAVLSFDGNALEAVAVRNEKIGEFEKLDYQPVEIKNKKVKKVTEEDAAELKEDSLDDVVVFALTSSVPIVNEVCNYLNIEPGKIDVKHFADGETLVELGESVRGKRCYIVQSTCRPVNDTLMEVLICLDAMRRSSAAEITCIIPYFGYARQDRKAQPRQPITAKLVASMLEEAGANRVVTFDLHAAQIQGFFHCPVDDLTTVPMMGQYFKRKGLDNDNVVVVSPDHGGVKRARNMADILNTQLAIIDKRRPRPNAVEACHIIGDVQDKDVVIVDDICDTGGSLIAASQILKDNGARDIYVCITHGLFSNNAAERIENSAIKEIVCTNTIIPSGEDFSKTSKITTLSIGWMLSKLILAVSCHTPVSEVYALYE
ncbi:MAG: ribose-phosphate pyrophosphokinase [Erysipelotrichaceae bacterium]|nr:ribose-phosphate pyrophosphokinase [Erysipelotrichaceae bacterium]